MPPDPGLPLLVLIPGVGAAGGREGQGPPAEAPCALLAETGLGYCLVWRKGWGPDCGGFIHQEPCAWPALGQAREEGGARRDVGQSGEPAGSCTRQKLSQGREG